jgi:DNA topoisomerase-1
MAQIGRQDDKDKPLYASMRKGQMIDTITLEEALDLFKLPRTLGSHDSKDIIVSIGRFGPYIKYGEEYISLPKSEDPYTVSLDRTIQIITGPRLPRKIGEYEGKEIIANKGFFGNYLKFGNTNASLPKQYDPFLITLEEAIPIVKAKEEKDKAKHIKSWEEDRRVKVVFDRWNNPSIQSGKKFFRVPKGKEPIELTLEECLTIAGFKKGKKVKAEPKSKEPKVKKEKVAKKPAVTKPKLRVVKAKKKFAKKK